MEKIKRLTKEQELKLSEYRDKWLKIGLSTDRIDKQEAIRICNDVQNKVLNRKATPVIVLRNPIEAWLAVCMFTSKEKVFDHVRAQVVDQVVDHIWAQVGAQVRDHVRAQVVDQVRAQVGAQVRDQVFDQVKAQVFDQVKAQVFDQVFDQVRDQVGAQVRDHVRAQVVNQVVDHIWAQVGAQVGAQVRDQVFDQVKAQVRDQVRDQVKNFIFPWLCGHNESSLFSFYDFMQNELNIKSNLWDKFNIWKETSKLGLIYPLEYICIVSEKPLEINIVNGKLHADGKPAIKFDGDFKVWSLNGIRVPQWLAETPESELKIEQYNELKNADVKAAFVQKFGIERMVDLGKVVDTYTNYNNEWYTKSEYQLVDMSPIFKTIKYAPYLKMINQTTGVYHLEGVHPDCKTIEDALNYRWGGRKGFKTEIIK